MNASKIKILKKGEPILPTRQIIFSQHINIRYNYYYYCVFLYFFLQWLIQGFSVQSDTRREN